MVKPLGGRDLLFWSKQRFLVYFLSVYFSSISYSFLIHLRFVSYSFLFTSHWFPIQSSFPIPRDALSGRGAWGFIGHNPTLYRWIQTATPSTLRTWRWEWYWERGPMSFGGPWNIATEKGPPFQRSNSRMIRTARADRRIRPTFARVSLGESQKLHTAWQPWITSWWLNHPF